MNPIVVLSISIIFMSWGFDPVIVTFISSLLICYITLFYQNGKNSKTIASFWSVALVLLILFAVTYTVGYESHIRGLSTILQRESDVFGLSPDINIDMAKIAVAMIITGLIGAATDTSIAVSSAVYEEFVNIIFSCLSCIMVIPLTALAISFILIHPERLKKHLKEDELLSDSGDA